MLFFTCVNKEYKQLSSIYKYCVKRVYPDANVCVTQINNNASCSRFLVNPKSRYVHITDADILILPHEKTHEEYYSQFAVNGACYVRGCTEGGGKKWLDDSARIADGHVGFYEEFYTRTKWLRKYYERHIENYREFDEVMLARILKLADYPIPEEPYTFHDILRMMHIRVKSDLKKLKRMSMILFYQKILHWKNRTSLS